MRVVQERSVIAVDEGDPLTDSEVQVVTSNQHQVVEIRVAGRAIRVRFDGQNVRTDVATWTVSTPA